MLSGAATLTFETSFNGYVFEMAFDGLERDQMALRTDATKSLRGLKLGIAQKERELLAG